MDRFPVVVLFFGLKEKTSGVYYYTEERISLIKLNELLERELLTLNAQRKRHNFSH